MNKILQHYLDGELELCDNIMKKMKKIYNYNIKFIEINSSSFHIEYDDDNDDNFHNYKKDYDELIKHNYLPEDFIERYIEYLNEEELAVYQVIPEHLVEKHFLKENDYCLIFLLLNNDFSIPIQKKIIQSIGKFAFINVLFLKYIKNCNLSNDDLLEVLYPDNIDYLLSNKTLNDEFYYKLFSKYKIFKVLTLNMNIFRDNVHISHKTYLKMKKNKDFINSYIDQICSNCILESKTIKDILNSWKIKNKPYTKLSLNEHLPIEIIKRYKNKLKKEILLSNNKNYKELYEIYDHDKQFWDSISMNKNLDEDFIITHKENINWKLMNFDITDKIFDKCKEYLLTSKHINRTLNKKDTKVYMNNFKNIILNNKSNLQDVISIFNNCNLEDDDVIDLINYYTKYNFRINFIETLIYSQAKNNNLSEELIHLILQNPNTHKIVFDLMNYDYIANYFINYITDYGNEDLFRVLTCSINNDLFSKIDSFIESYNEAIILLINYIKDDNSLFFYKDLLNLAELPRKIEEISSLKTQ